ncbi:regulatory protein [Salmonella enterica subsp. enterica serovar Sanjuan]|uniref:Regulatory protein n=1 Tax=Salmonella enterica subsp. enterica serovar Sanjuan TaxID=1160765 RepID=A0A3S4FZB8_SALET|nr:regulatory protein [Salmonella enterica subsp. enterica serovar Sanjuan]
MKFERHHRILKELSISGVVKVSNLAKSLKVTKETIRSDLNELAGQGYLTRCHGGAFITLILLITSQKMKLLMCWKNMNQRRK